MRSSTFILSLVLLLVSSAHADAQEVDIKVRASGLVSKGLQSQEAGRYDEAIGFYKAAYDLLPHPELLFNLGQAYRLKGDRVVALDYYRKYIALQPKGRASKEARDWIEKIERAMRDEAAAESRKRDAQRVAESERRAAELHRREEDRLTTEQQGEKEAGAEAEPLSEPVQTAPPQRPRADDPLTSREKAGIATGLGAVFVWAGAYGLAINDKDSLAAGFVVAGGALAAASLYLLLNPSPTATAPPKTARRLAPAFDQHSASLVWAGSF